MNSKYWLIIWELRGLFSNDLKNFTSFIKNFQKKLIVNNYENIYFKIKIEKKF